MRKYSLVALPLVMLLVSGCRVKKETDANGNTKYEAEPAKVEVHTESTTVAVPKVELAPDTGAKDTTRTTR